MYHLKSIVSRSAAIATKQQLAKIVPVTVLQNRNYADHQIPERLKDVATARGNVSMPSFCAALFVSFLFFSFSFFALLNQFESNFKSNRISIDYH